ncbi:MAG: hypothetical protein DCC49_09455 [Acidobacteria bacterium]|nr:MAG: hypothetical protein DCC49_09455 [Acidobacteriota bacterium]
MALTAYLLRRQIKPVLIWGASIGLMALWVVLYYPSIAKTDFFQQYLEAIPEQMRAFLNVLGGDVSTIQGFLGIELFSLVLPVSIPFYAVVLGSRAIAGAEQQGRLEILLSAPVRRSEIVVATVVEMLAGIAAILVLIGLFTWIPAKAVGTDLTIGQTASGLVALLPFSFFFGALALLISSAARRSGISTSIVGGALVAMYFINGFAGFVESMRPLQKASLFYHYRSALVGGVNWHAWFVILVISFVLALGAIPVFNRRDIYG